MKVEEYRHQVGGHCKLIKPKDSSKVYKPLIENEYIFYEKLANFGASSAESGPLHILKKFIPKFYGVTEIVVEYSSSSEMEDNLVRKQKRRNEPNSSKGRKYFSLEERDKKDKLDEQPSNEPTSQRTDQSAKEPSREPSREPSKEPSEELPKESPQGETEGEKDTKSDKSAKGKKRKKCIPHIVLEDLVYGFKRPCVLDIKMGKRQRKIGASLEKRKRQVEKSFKTTSHSLGFRLCGCQLYNKTSDKLFYKDKYWGRNLTKENIPWAIRNWFWNGSLLYEELIPLLLEKLHRFFNCIMELRHYRFWSSSLLWVFDGGLNDQKARSNSLDIRMIDFANTIYLQDNPSVDDEYIFGLKNLIHSMQILNNTIQGMNFLPQEISTCFYSENYKLIENSHRPIFKKSKSAILEENLRKKKKKKKNVYINFEFLKNAKTRRKSSNVYSSNMTGALATQLAAGSPKGTSDDGLSFQYLNKFIGNNKKEKIWNQAQYFSNSDSPIGNHMSLSPYSTPVGTFINKEVCISGWLDESLPRNVTHGPGVSPDLNIPLIPPTSVDDKNDGSVSAEHSHGSDIQEKANITTFNESEKGPMENELLALEAHQIDDHRRSDHHSGMPSKEDESVSPINLIQDPKGVHLDDEDELVDMPKKTITIIKHNERSEQMSTNNSIDERRNVRFEGKNFAHGHFITAMHETDGRNRHSEENAIEKEEVQTNFSFKNKNRYPVNHSEEETCGVTEKGEIPQSENYQKCVNKSGEKQIIDDKQSRDNALLFQTRENVSFMSAEGDLFGEDNSNDRNESNAYEQVIQEVIVKTLKVASRGRDNFSSVNIANKIPVDRNYKNRIEDERKNGGYRKEGEPRRHENAFTNFYESEGKDPPYKHEYILSNEGNRNEVAENGDEGSDRKVSDAEVEKKEENRRSAKQDLGNKGSYAEKYTQQYAEQYTQGGLNQGMLKKREHRIRSALGPKLRNDSLVRETKWNLLIRNVNLKVFINHMIKKEIEGKKNTQEYPYLFVKNRNETDPRALHMENRPSKIGGLNRISRDSRARGGVPPIHNPYVFEKSLSYSYSHRIAHSFPQNRNYSYSSDSGLIYNRNLQGGHLMKMLKKEGRITSKRCSSCTDIPLRIKKGKKSQKKKKYIKKKLFKKINILSGVKNNRVKSPQKIIFSNYAVPNQHSVTPPIEYTPRSDSICRITHSFDIFTPEYRRNRYVHSVISQRYNTDMDSTTNNQTGNIPFREKNLILPLTDTNSNEKYLRRSMSEPNLYKFGYFRCILNDLNDTKINYNSLVANRLDKMMKVPIYNQIYGFTSNSSDLDSSDTSWGY
ncbi:inositol polyphosphate kinase, putative [Plasmodium knowlesi strain H]|uniref:Kinase n=3 Tax=Plasmodium knowlesi TaxID=5850 RepID=A0A5K1TUT1_PLAKH|nr:inositol polyphosphate kinase, putative [Plasmodium knowlesi strain H]OTN64271.1 Kinase [Plasmodium knowlesi]CAA9990768.1 inositol polyphosphate kinase, putative [Plasmodium knowlesi strain H]SBO21115.1 inositol polyphosphate kinase, putative [Plasmodium knowlesi strain H]SBO21587.1 inositol polyphosphate kinase, putative [Plasmodium knowlesi strain H]VVS80242.1 inositol polyphosphate kinase, putative [Plasmodium knowlesi strain H]|eukprot:XP_002262058.1 Inositol polyphosphate kinase, putative [Plasmodium knowlesi strain H]